MMRLDGEVVLVEIQSLRPGVVSQHLQAIRKALVDFRLQSVVITARSIGKIRDVLRPIKRRKERPAIVLSYVAVRRRCAYAIRKLRVEADNARLIRVDVRIVAREHVSSLV